MGSARPGVAAEPAYTAQPVSAVETKIHPGDLDVRDLHQTYLRHRGVSVDVVAKPTWATHDCPLSQWRGTAVFRRLYRAPSCGPSPPALLRREVDPSGTERFVQATEHKLGYTER